MAGFLRRLFGGGKKPGGDAAQSGTVQASRAVESAAHVETIRSEQFNAVAARKGEPADQEKDTGPWFIGKTVGEIYQIRGVLGRGGMGIVYRGFDTATQREIAVKVPLGKFVDDESGRKRFAREAEAWSGLVHPHIVHAFDVKDDQTTDYRPAVFMDYCDGGSLADRLRNGPPLSMTDALDIAIQVCWAMEFAHEKGHIHRDLKPGNVLLTKAGKALVSDFGLVKSLDLEDLEVTQEQLKQQDEALQASLTRGLAMGTPEYMPPEQWAGNACPQSDIYAFGIMLYELFCGGRPFSAQNRADLWIPHCKVPAPDPRRLNGRLPDKLAELMSSCLAKKPAERPQTFAAVADRLAECYGEIAGKPYASRREKPTATALSREQQQGQAWVLIRLGVGCQLRGDLDDAMRHYGKAREVFQQIEDQEGFQVCLGNQALILKTRGDLDRAMEFAEEKLRICQVSGNLKSIGAALDTMAGIFYGRGDLDRSMEFLKQEEQICRKLEDKGGLQRTLGNQAGILIKRGDSEGAIRLLKDQEQICCELENKDDLQRTLGNQAMVLMNCGKLTEAMTLLKRKEALCRELGNIDSLQISLGSQAVILQKWGRPEKAIKLLKKQEAICHELGKKDGLQASLGNQANILYALGDLDGALKLYRQKEAICRELRNKDGLSSSLNGQAVILQARDDLDGAMKLHKQQEAICRELGNKDGLSGSLGNQALILQARGDLDGAMKLHKQEEAICRELGNPEGLQRSLGNQAMILFARDDLDGAMKLHKQEEAICRELGNVNGLAISLSREAYIVGLKMGRPHEALPLAEEAYRLASDHGLTALAGQVKSILDQIRAQAG